MTHYIRAAVPGDVAALRALNDACLEVKYTTEFYTQLSAALAAAVAASAGATRAAPPADERLACYVALDNGALVGAVTARVAARVAFAVGAAASADSRWWHVAERVGRWLSPFMALLGGSGGVDEGGDGAHGSAAASGIDEAAADAAAQPLGGAAADVPPGALVAYVMTLGVAPSHRRRGVARALLLALLSDLLQPPGSAAAGNAGEAEAGGSGTPVFGSDGSSLFTPSAATTPLSAAGSPRAAACQAVELHVLASNAAARALYGSLGFTAVEHLPAYYAFDGATHAAVLMRRLGTQLPVLLPEATPAAAAGSCAGAGRCGSADGSDEMRSCSLLTAAAERSRPASLGGLETGDNSPSGTARSSPVGSATPTGSASGAAAAQDDSPPCAAGELHGRSTAATSTASAESLDSAFSPPPPIRVPRVESSTLLEQLDSGTDQQAYEDPALQWWPVRLLTRWLS